MGYGLKIDNSKAGNVFLENWLKKVTVTAATPIKTNQAVNVVDSKANVMEYKYVFPSTQVGYALSERKVGETVEVALLEPINELPKPTFYYNSVIPDPVTNFKSSLNRNNLSINLSWTNPSGNGWTGTTIIRKVGGIPTSVTDGTVVYSGTATSYKDTGVSVKNTYYYRAFTHNKYNQYNNASVTTSQAIGGINMPSFSGGSTSYGNGVKGRIEINGSGTLTLESGVYDICILDGGINGDYTYEAAECPTHGLCGVMYCVTPEEEEISNEDSAGISIKSDEGISPYGVNTATAGRGGYITTLKGISLSGNYNVSIAGSDGSSSIGSYTTASGTRAYSGAGSGTNGSLGSNTTTKPFNGDSSEFNIPLSGGGSTASGTAGGYYGGGSYNTQGTANTGGGGGIPATQSGTTSVKINGGSGKIIVRWGY